VFLSQVNALEAYCKAVEDMGGKTSAENCQVLCKNDNRTKSGK